MANGLRLLLINAPPPNYTGGMPGYAAVPEGTDRFQRDIRRVLRYAEALKAGKIHVMAGYAKGEVGAADLYRKPAMGRRPRAGAAVHHRTAEQR